MFVELENNAFKVRIDSLGAEVQSFYSKEQNIEYMWQANPSHWNRQSPILFPIVGALTEDTYEVDGEFYSLPRHGFARDLQFEVSEQSTSKVIFLLTDSTETKKVYPFSFKLYIEYSLENSSLKVSYRVINPSDKTLLFSIGAHPAFAVPFNQKGSLADYQLVLKESKTVTQLPLIDNIINEDTKKDVSFEKPIDLSHQLFETDALIFETSGENTWMIQSPKSNHSVSLSYDGFPYVGIWSTYPVASDFICIEPWYGIADTNHSTGKLAEKTGIESLAANEEFHASYTITVK